MCNRCSRRSCGCNNNCNSCSNGRRTTATVSNYTPDFALLPEIWSGVNLVDYTNRLYEIPYVDTTAANSTVNYYDYNGGNGCRSRCNSGCNSGCNSCNSGWGCGWLR